MPPVRPGGENPWQRRHLVRLAFSLATAILIANALIGDRGLPANLRMQREHRELAETVADLKAANRQLRREAERLRNDPAAIEEMARRDLGLVRPGERIFIVADRPAPAPVERGPVGGPRDPRRMVRHNPAAGDLIASNRWGMIAEPLSDDVPVGGWTRSTD